MKNNILKLNRKELLSIPNCMGYFRILLIPVFCFFYIKDEFHWATLVLVISTITDFLDGQIARRFNMITEFGKILDPVADKFTHAAIAICLTFRYNLMIWIVILMVLKEGFMAVMGIVNFKHGMKLDGAKWCGKICTACLFISFIILVVFYTIPENIANIIIVVNLALMVYTFIMYIIEYIKISKTWEK